MKIVRTFLLIASFIWIAIQESSAQFKFSGEFRPRTEYSHGYRTLANENQKASLLERYVDPLKNLYRPEALAKRVDLKRGHLFIPLRRQPSGRGQNIDRQ